MPSRQHLQISIHVFLIQIEKIISSSPACLGFHGTLYQWFYASRNENKIFSRSPPSKQDILYNLQFCYA